MKKIVTRKCLATGKILPKRELIRIVRDKDGRVFLDKTGKANGRGAYISRTPDALKIARKKHLIDRSLKAKVPEEVYAELEALIGEGGEQQ